MPFDGSGGFLRTQNWQADAAAGIKIVADRHDNEDDNFANGLSSVITKDGQTSLTAHIPFNGFRATGLANPVDPQDAATKSYADSVRNFPTAIFLTGGDVAGVSKAFIGFTAADIGFGARQIDSPVAGQRNRFVWNDKADLTGNDLAMMDDTAGAFSLTGSTNVNVTYAFNAYVGDTPAVWNAATTGFGSYFTFEKATGLLSYVVASVSAAADAPLTMRTVFSVSKDLVFETDGRLLGEGSVMAQASPGGAQQPAIGAWSHDRNAANGLWIGPANQLVLGSMGGNGVPTEAWAIMTSANCNFIGSASFSGDINFWIGRSGDGKYFHAEPNCHLSFNVATKDWFLSSTGGVRWTSRNSDGYFICPTAIIAPGGLNPASDQRIKNVAGDFTMGLVEIVALQPKRFTYKGNDTSDEPAHLPTPPVPGTPEGPEPQIAEEPPTVPYPNSPHFQMARDQIEVVGLIAQECETAAPDLVSISSGYIDGDPVDDLRGIKEQMLIYALVNAVKTIDQRLTALETI